MRTETEAIKPIRYARKVWVGLLATAGLALNLAFCAGFAPARTYKIRVIIIIPIRGTCDGTPVGWSL
jgi:hypothetical protein